MDNKEFNSLTYAEKEKFIDPRLMSVLAEADFEKMYASQANLKIIPKNWVKEGCEECVNECSETIPVSHKAFGSDSFEVECESFQKCEEFEDLFLKNIINNIKKVIEKNNEHYRDYKMVLTFPTIIEEGMNFMTVSF